jgi:hypothetical protein
MKSKAEQLAEERYPYHTGQMVGSITNQILFSETVVDKQRAAFIAGYEAACDLAINELNYRMEEYSKLRIVMPQDEALKKETMRSLSEAVTVLEIIKQSKTK